MGREVIVRTYVILDLIAIVAWSTMYPTWHSINKPGLARTGYNLSLSTVFLSGLTFYSIDKNSVLFDTVLPLVTLLIRYMPIKNPPCMILGAIQSIVYLILVIDIYRRCRDGKKLMFLWLDIASMIVFITMLPSKGHAIIPMLQLLGIVSMQMYMMFVSVVLQRIP